MHINPNKSQPTRNLRLNSGLKQQEYKSTQRTMLKAKHDTDYANQFSSGHNGGNQIKRFINCLDDLELSECDSPFEVPFEVSQGMGSSGGISTNGGMSTSGGMSNNNLMNSKSINESDGNGGRTNNTCNDTHDRNVNWDFTRASNSNGQNNRFMVANSVGINGEFSKLVSFCPDGGILNVGSTNQNNQDKSRCHIGKTSPSKEGYACAAINENTNNSSMNSPGPAPSHTPNPNYPNDDQSHQNGYGGVHPGRHNEVNPLAIHDESSQFLYINRNPDNLINISSINSMQSSSQTAVLSDQMNSFSVASKMLPNDPELLKEYYVRAKKESEKLKDQNLKLRLERVKLTSSSETMKLIPLKIQLQNIKKNIDKLTKEKQLLLLSREHHGNKLEGSQSQSGQGFGEREREKQSERRRQGDRKNSTRAERQAQVQGQTRMQQDQRQEEHGQPMDRQEQTQMQSKKTNAVASNPIQKSNYNQNSSSTRTSTFFRKVSPTNKASTPATKTIHREPTNGSNNNSLNGLFISGVGKEKRLGVNNSPPRMGRQCFEQTMNQVQQSKEQYNQNVSGLSSAQTLNRNWTQQSANRSYEGLSKVSNKH